MPRPPLEVVMPEVRSPPGPAGGHGESMLVLVHIPRTAGTTLAMILRHHYRGGGFHGGGNAFARSGEIESRLRGIAAKPHVRAVAGHLTFGLADRLLPSARYAVILRDPVERTLSHYNVLVRPRRKRSGVEVRPVGLLPAGSSPVPLGSTIEEVVGEGGSIADNLQTRMVCGLVSPYDELPADALARAKSNLRERFAFVGTTERFDQFLALLNIELGWPTLGYRRSRAKPGRVTRDQVTPEEIALIEERTALDRELHAYAGALLDEALDRVGPELEAEVEAVREAARRWTERRRAPEPAELRALDHDARVALALKEAELARAQRQVRRLERAKKTLRKERRQREG